MLRASIALCLFMILQLFIPRQAAACGGFFCSTLPMNQLSERILFVDRGDSVTTHVQIQYAGAAADFAWVLPVPSPPTLAVSHNELFRQLQFATQPQFVLEWEDEGECSDVFPPIYRTLEDAETADDGGVTIVSEQRVGPYETVVLSSDDPQAILRWLLDNEYVLGELGPDLLQPYVDGGFYFIALRLAPDRDVGDLQPIALSYAAESPGIPIQLTAIATEPDLGVTAWILGEARAVPTNYLHVRINEALIDWFNGGFNYNDVVGAAVDAADGGQAFVTDYAGSSRIMSGRLPTDRFDTQQLAEIEDAARFLDTSLQQGLPRDQQMQALLRRHMPMPVRVLDEGVLHVVFRGDRESYDQAAADGTLNGIAERSFYSDIAAYEEWLEGWRFDPAALAADLERVVVQPLRAVDQLFADHPYLTRLYTTLSAHEMTVDPMFAMNPDLPEISNIRTARAHWECGEIDPENPDLTQLVLVVTLRDGRQIRSRPFIDGPWPLARETDLPAAALVERLDTSGPPVLLQRLTAVDETTSPAIPTTFGLHPVYPNPFNATVIIPFTVPADLTSEVRLSVHNLLGQSVRDLISGARPVGRQQAVWDGRNAAGQSMASGVYLIRLETADRFVTQKILYLR